MTDPTDVRAAFREMADPTRWRAYMLLSSLGEMRAGTLARMVGVSDAVMRRHLEVMEGLQLVASRDSTEARAGRLWSKVRPTAESSGLRVEFGPAGSDLSESREVSEWLKVVVEVSGDIVSGFLEQRAKYGTAWLSATELQDYVLLLTRDELQQLGNELQNVVTSWIPTSRRHLAEPDPDAQPAYVVTHAVLYPRPDGPSRA